jgi:tetratricopeptide (TPR) repeat protein
LSSEKLSQKKDLKGINLAAPIWLVKSGGRITGPFSTDEVAGKLRGRELSIIDEVTRPLSRWRIVRDEPLFQNVVEEVRRIQMNAREDTEVQGSSEGLTRTSSDYENTASSFEPLTATSHGDSAFSVGAIKDVEFTESNVRSQLKGGDNREDGANSRLRQYGVSSDAHQADKIRSVSRGVWVVAIVVIAASSFMWFHSQSDSNSEPGIQSKDFSHTLQEANSDWRRGDFAGALALFKVADRLKPRDPQVVARLAPLWIHLETQTVSAKRKLLETLNTLPPDVNPNLKGDLQIGVGLAALASDDLSEADANFRVALLSVPTSTSARFDYAMTAYKERQFIEAARRFSSAGDGAPSLVMFALSLISSDRDSRSPGRHRADDALKKVMMTSQDYLQEAQVIGALLSLEAGENKLAVSRLRAALDTDPDLTSEHWHDPLQFLEPLGWRELVPYCQSLNDELKSYSAKAFLGLCLFKAGERERAVSVIEEALGASPDDAVLRSVNAYMLTVDERFEDARASLSLAMSKPNPPKLAQLLRAKLCMRGGDMICAEQAYSDLVKQNPPSLSAMAGLAEIYSQKGDQAKAAEWIAKARDLSPSYKPVLSFHESQKDNKSK